MAPELLLFTLRLELVLLLLTLRLELVLPLLTLRLEPELELLLLTLRVALLGVELLLTLRLEPVVPLLTLRLTFESELLLLTLRLELELVLLGRSYVLPDCADLDVTLLTEREELERLEVAGATLLTPDVFSDCATLRLEAVFPLLTLRFAVELELLLTLRLELELTLFTLRDEAVTLLPLFTDLDATVAA